MFMKIFIIENEIQLQSNHYIDHVKYKMATVRR